LRRTTLESDAVQLQRLAFKVGASRAITMDTKQIVTDERVQLKCRYPPCQHYGRNLMCPPFTPSASQFKEYLSRYRRAILVEVEDRVPKNIKRTLSSNEKRYAELIKEKSFLKRYDKWHAKVWRKLHRVVSEVEREAFRRNYYFSLGLGAEHCELCPRCDVESSCKNPLRARPSMEAVGIDVYRTIKNAGFTLKWNPYHTINLYGLVLIG